MVDAEDIHFRAILIIGAVSKHRKGLATAIARMLDKPRFFAIDPAKQKLPGARFNWASVDLVVTDLTTHKSVLKEWFASMQDASMPPSLFFDLRATVDDAGDLYRAGAADYMVLAKLTRARLHIALDHARNSAAGKRGEQNDTLLMEAQLSEPGTEADGEAKPGSPAAAGKSDDIINTGLLSILERDAILKGENPADRPMEEQAGEKSKPGVFMNTGLMSLLERKTASGDGMDALMESALAASSAESNWPFTRNEIRKGTAKYRGYKVLEYLGAGGTASVFKVERESDKKVFALKLFDSDTPDHQGKQRFLRGYELLSGIRHPHIVACEEMSEDGDYAYVVLEYLSGGDLHTRIRQLKKISRGATIRYAAQVAAALDYAHTNDLLHRDLKPSNIMFRDDDSVALVDFGIAKSEHHDQTHLTQAGQVMGTPYYLSPEQATGKQMDSRSDLYALGVMMYEMIEGKRPFDGKNQIDIMMGHVHGKVPDMESPDEALNEIIRKLLAKKPEERYQSGQEVVDALHGVAPNRVPQELLAASA